MATRRSTRNRRNLPNLTNLDQFKHTSSTNRDEEDSDIDISDRNTNSSARDLDDVSSADTDSTSEEEYDEQDADEDSNASYSDTEVSASGSDESEDTDVYEGSDSDYAPGKRSNRAKKKPTARKKKAVPKKTRGRKRKRSDTDSESGSNETDGEDEEYRPNGQTRKKRKTIKKKQAIKAIDPNVRRSTRNLGKTTVKYDDATLYGEIEGLYDEDTNLKDAKKKQYKEVAKRRKRGGIKKLHKTTKNNEDSRSNSITPNTKRRLRLKLKLNRNKKNQESLNSSPASTQRSVSMMDDDDISSIPPSQALYTYTSWLDDIVSDTECKYVSRNRLMPAKINHVEYIFEIQTSNGIDTISPESGKMKPSTTKNEESKENKDDTMDIDADEDDDIKSNKTNEDREWFHKLKVGDFVQCHNEEENVWQDNKISFINRRFDLQYLYRNSLNKESIHEYDLTTGQINPTLREKMKPSIDIEETPPPATVSATVSPKKKRKKKNKRFNDSDESQESESESEEDSEYDDDDLASRTQSVSPIDDLSTKIELILYRLQLPRSTAHYRDTFKHLIKKEASDTTTNTKEEMDIDASETVQKDTEMEDKENIGDNRINAKANTDESLIATDDEDDTTTNNAKEVARETQLVTKYLVKFWNRSYHQCEWWSLRQLREVDADTKVQNYDRKWDVYDRRVKKINTAISLEKYHSVHFFNDLYLEIDRIISYAEPGEHFDTVSGYTSSNKQFQININTSDETMYLVKWKGMQYDEATWEMESFLKSEEFELNYHGSKEIELLIERQKIPPSRFLHPGPGKWNTNYFKNKPKSEIRVSDDKVFKGGRKLRGKYQKDGVNWLVNNWQYKQSCILADEMGLGKTVQTVTFVNWLFDNYDQRGPFLIVAPLSTIAHWQREFRAWSDLNVIVYHGSASSRERIVHEEFDWLWTDARHPRAKTARDLKRLNSNNFKFNVMITTPQIVNCDYKILDASKVAWNTIIVDEAHSLKSPKSLFYRTLSTFKCPYTQTVLLTGTPIQNNMHELWSLLHFMDPVHFADQEDFVARFENLAESKDELKELLKARLLQRLKYLVEKNLGQREEKIIWVELTLFQKKWYKALYQRSYEKLKACGAAKASLMNVTMQLRKCCNHPFLMRDVERTISPEGSDLITMNENLIKSSGKLVLLDKLLPKLKREGHRVLIFSQMSHLLDILEDYLNYRQHLYERIDGSVTGMDRQEAIDRYQKDDSIFAFILTTRAGGVGINLMAADTVIIYDSDWNPMNDLQAVARCHRIGQKKQVRVYRLITRNCYEEGMFKRADQKLALNKVVMGDMKDVSKTDIHHMLKKGAIAMFLNDAQTDDDIRKFADANIDDILSTRTETVTHDADTNDPDAAMFSEAVFVANADDANVNVDDENFWEVLGVGKEEEDPAYTSPYRRRRTRAQARSNLMYDSEGFEMDGTEYSADEEGTSLLGVLSYVIYGKWKQILEDLHADEKTALRLEDDENDKEPETVHESIDINKNNKAKNVLDEKTEEEYVPNGAAPSTNNDAAVSDIKDSSKTEEKEKEEKKLSDQQVEILKQAAVETICKMANLMRPDVRNQKLGIKFSKLQSMFLDKEFRIHCIETLADQIYEQDIVRGNAWKQAVQNVWKIKDTKNRFVDKKQLENRPNLCKMGCKRLTNANTNPNNNRVYDTCCANCANNTAGKKDLVHESYCEKRHYNDWRCHIRDEALKTYLKQHPLETKPKETNDAANTDEKDSAPTTETSTDTYLVAQPAKAEMFKYIRSELRYHDSTDLVLAMRTRIINVKSLRDELKNKTHGDIVSILLKLERMFKFKTMCSLHKKNIKKLDFSSKKPTKAMPEWWESKWDHCMVEGTLKYGWGIVPPQFAIESYGFTPTYKGVKKVKKTKKQAAEDKRMKEIQNGLKTVQIDNDSSTNNTTSVASSVAATPSPADAPVMIVKKRVWLAEGKKQESILISICNHFRKEIREKYKKLTTKIKKENKLREQRTYNPSMSKAANSANETHKKSKKKKDKKKEKKEKKKNAFDMTKFDKMNSIKNYFGCEDGKKNAFDILGKKKKKKKKDKYEKTKLDINFDENGAFKVPIKITKTKMIKSLGTICTEKGYHATSYIYPVGFECVIAQLPSLKRYGKTTTFTTVIVKSDEGPLFQITCSDDPSFKLSAKNPSKVWGELKALWLDLEDTQKEQKEQKEDNNNNNNEGTPSKKRSGSGHGISGPQKMGLAHTDIKRALECLPNALKCVNYKFKYRMDKDESLSPKKAFKKTLRKKKDKEKKSNGETPQKKEKKVIISTAVNQNKNNSDNVHTMSSVSDNIANSNNNNSNVIVIEDSPAAAATTTAAVNGSEIINTNTSKNDSEVIAVIDLCNDSDHDDAQKTKQKSRKRKHALTSTDNNANNAFSEANDSQPTKKRKFNNEQQANISSLWPKQPQ